MPSDKPIPGRCGRKNKRGGFCSNHPIKGGTVCRMHGGGAKQVKAAAKRRKAKAEAEAEARRMIAEAGTDLDPIEHLVSALHRAAALVEVWGSLTADLDEQGGLVNHSAGGAAQIHPFADEYRRALDQRARIAKLCIDAGIAERQVELAEEQGRQIATVIQGVLEELGVADREEVPSLVRKQLAAVAGS